MFKLLQTENDIRKSSEKNMNQVWKRNRMQVLLQHNENDIKNLEFTFSYFVKKAICNHFEHPQVIFTYYTTISIDLSRALFFDVEKHFDVLKPSVQRHLSLVTDFLGLPNDILLYGKFLSIKPELTNAYGSKCIIVLTLCLTTLNDAVQKRKSILLIQQWIRRCLYAPNTGILFKAASKRAILSGFLP